MKRKLGKAIDRVVIHLARLDCRDGFELAVVSIVICTLLRMKGNGVRLDR